MPEFVEVLQETSLPNILVVAGIIFLFAALAGTVSGKIEVPKERQLWFGLSGAFLLISGIVLHLFPSLLTSELPSLRIEQVEQFCGSYDKAPSFSDTKIDRRNIEVDGSWDKDSSKKFLWVFLSEKSDEAVLMGKRNRPSVPVGPQQDWKVFLNIPEEADEVGKHFWLSALAVDPEVNQELQNGSPTRSLANLLDASLHHQRVRIERVENVENPVCPENGAEEG